MTGPALPVTEEGQDPDAQWPGGGGTGIGRAAALIATLTVLARVLGLVRTLVFAGTVGNSCLGTAYVTANQVPNIIYDIVIGGALTSIMVPVLARPARLAQANPADARQVTQVSSALLSWTIVILVPVSLVFAAASGPIAVVLNPRNLRSGCGHADLVTVTGHMLAVFAPQILLYGLAAVLYGILQAHRKFAAPALAPVISSLVVITAYLVFVPFGGKYAGRHMYGLPLSAELILSVGTTLGVAALVVTAAVPAWRLRLRLRPTLRFPAGVASRVRGLALVGIAALVAQDASGLVVILLANGRGLQGAVVLYNYGWQVFETAYAVLAISIAVSAFPLLSVREGAEFDETAAASTRAVLLMSFLGAAVIAAIARPAGQLFASPHVGLLQRHVQAHELALGLVMFAPGLVGFGIMACLSRVLLAVGRNWLAAAAISGGWLAVIIADVLIVELVPARFVVAALGLGNSIGLTAAGIALILAVRSVRGGAALRGGWRAAGAGLCAAVVAAGVGGAVSAELPVTTRLSGAGVVILAGCCAIGVFLVIGYLLDVGDLRAAVSSVRRAVLR